MVGWEVVVVPIRMTLRQVVLVVLVQRLLELDEGRGFGRIERVNSFFEEAISRNTRLAL